MEKGTWQDTVHGVTKELDLVTKQQNIYVIYLLISSAHIYPEINFAKLIQMHDY